MGTGGFITDALDLLDEWHKVKKMIAPAVIVPYGQECEDESWAMGKSNLLLRNVGDTQQDQYNAIKDLSAHIMLGDTLMDDKFADSTFNFILSNPPYGKKWEKQKDSVEEEAKLGFKGRFGAGLPSIDDGSMLFLQHVVSKFAPVEKGGGKAGIVLSGSPLFTGDAGSGPSNIRRWLFEKDYIDCIVKLPSEIFFRTGISTYLWILSNKKSADRKGLIQLIDASDMKTTMKKPQGNKRYCISEEQINWIIRTYVDGHDHGKSVLVPKDAFMFRKVTTQRPLHMAIIVNENRLNEFFDLKPMTKFSHDNKAILKAALLRSTEEELPYDWASTFAKEIRRSMVKPEATPAELTKAILDVFGVKNKKYDIVLDKNGKPVPDPDFKDFENIPFGTSFEDYMNKEVLPYACGTWIDESVMDKGPLQDGEVGVVGTNISFNKYFYHYEQPRKPEDIAAEILDIERGLESFMEGFLK